NGILLPFIGMNLLIPTRITVSEKVVQVLFLMGNYLPVQRKEAMLPKSFKFYIPMEPRRIYLLMRIRTLEPICYPELLKAYVNLLFKLVAKFFLILKLLTF